MNKIIKIIGKKILMIVLIISMSLSHVPASILMVNVTANATSVNDEYVLEMDSECKAEVDHEDSQNFDSNMNPVHANSTEETLDAPAVAQPAHLDEFMRESFELFNTEHIRYTMGITGEGLRGVVLDTDVDYNHPRLQRYQDPETGRIRGQNFTTDDVDDIMDIDAANFNRDVDGGLMISPSGGLLDFGSVEINSVWSPFDWVTMRNLGDQPTGEVNIALSGINKTSFAFDNLPTTAANRTPFSFTLPGISPSFGEEFSIYPVLGLHVGIYHATLVISGENIPTQMTNLRFEVEETNEDIIWFFSYDWLTRDLDFGTAIVDYPQLNPEEHRILPTINNPGHIVLTIEGQNPDAFVIYDDTFDDWPFNSQHVTRLRPQTGLAIGKYEATVVARRIDNSNILGSFNVYFRVVDPNTHDIELNPYFDHDFGSSIVEFNNHHQHWVEVRNAGDQPTGILTLALTGENSNSFRLSTSSISLGVNGSANFTVTPVDGLPIGTHTATVSVSGAHDILETFDVRITVEPMPETEILGSIRDVFPDESLAELITLLLGNDKTVDNIITQLHLEMITSINGRTASIVSLQGMQYLRNLRTLDVATNEIRDLSPLSELPELIRLNLTNNQIQDLTSLSSLINLQSYS